MVFSVSRHGLSKVYEPKQGVEPVAHIVFVHGLFGHPFNTWCGQIPRSNSPRPNNEPAVRRSPAGNAAAADDAVSQEEERLLEAAPVVNGSTCIFWPRVLLPDILPDTRIFTWGYDADIHRFGSSASQNTIHQHASNLLSDLADLQESYPDTWNPIIFVVHSLGGLIVKDALNQSSQTEGTRLKGIVPAVCGICFLGTPHRGSKSASIGRVAYQVTLAATRRPNLKLLQALERNSETLDRIGDSFRQTILKRNIQIYSFREEKETRKYIVFSTIVVDSDSAKIGDGKEEVGSIPENHSDMTKYTTAFNVGYKRLSAQLGRWVRELRAKNPQILQDYHNCISSLDNAESRKRIKDISKSYERTFQWLFDPAKVRFSEWLEDDKNNIGPMFWIQGKPGSGKSTLMKFAMHDVRTMNRLKASDDHQWVFVGFFFHDRGSNEQKSLSAMLQEMLYQVVLQLRDLTPVIQPFYEKLRDNQRTVSPVWDIETLQAALSAIMEQRKVATRLCFFLDALDEHAGDNSQLASLLDMFTSKIDNNRMKVKVCLASRSWNVFATHFGDCPGFAIHDYTRDDISIYTFDNLSRSLDGAVWPMHTKTSSRKLSTLIELVTEKARGVFIWVRLVVDELVRGVLDGTPLSELEAIVSNMPPELRDLYSRTLSRIEKSYAEEAYIMLQIALCCLQPLPLETFLNCTSYIKWGKCTEEFESRADMIRRLKSRSGGLLEIASTTVTGATQADEEGRFQEAEPTEFTRSSSSAPSSRATREMNHNAVKSSSPVVQFIHQTVIEFVRDCRENLGLPEMNNPDTTIAKESGYLLLLRCGARIEHDWADVISKDMFVYAYFAETGGSDVYQELEEMRVPAPGRVAANRFGWLLSQSPFEYYLSLRPERTMTAMLLYLAVAANLFSYVRYATTNTILWNFSFNDQLKRDLLQVAMFGPKIVPGQDDHLKMVKLLLELGPSSYYIDNISFTHAPRSIVRSKKMLKHGTKGFSDSRIGQYTILTLLLSPATQQFLSEREHFLIAKVLLEGGADSNIQVPQAFTDEAQSFPALEHCVRYESEEMVRLFLQYGAGTINEQICRVALLRRDPGVLSALRESGSTSEARRDPETGELMDTLQCIVHCGILGAALCGVNSLSA